MFSISVGRARFQASDENFFHFRQRFLYDKGPQMTKTETKLIFVSVSAEIFVTIRIGLRACLGRVHSGFLHIEVSKFPSARTNRIWVGFLLGPNGLHSENKGIEVSNFEVGGDAPPAKNNNAIYIQ